MQGLTIICAGILVSAAFFIVINYLQQVSDVDFKIWDVETVTASDFTVDFDLDASQWAQFKKLHYLKYKKEGGSLLLSFELYIKDEIEKIVEKSSDAQEGPELFEIAVITFATKNKTLMKLLKERGSYITAGKLTKILKMDTKIYRYT